MNLRTKSFMIIKGPHTGSWINTNIQVSVCREQNSAIVKTKIFVLNLANFPKHPDLFFDSLKINHLLVIVFILYWALIFYTNCIHPSKYTLFHHHAWLDKGIWASSWSLTTPQNSMWFFLWGITLQTIAHARTENLWP